MTKTPEQMAEEHVIEKYPPLREESEPENYLNVMIWERKTSFLAGYQAAKEQLQPQPFHKGADVYIIDANNPLPKPMPLSIAEQDQLADAGKVMCNTTMEEIKAVDTGELMPITNLPTSAKWISVKERLPEIGAPCLVTCHEERYAIAEYDGTKWTTLNSIAYYHPIVTHWHPLPNAPKGEG